MVNFLKEKEPLDVGSTSYVYPTEFGVVKLARRGGATRGVLSVIEERRIHALVAATLQHPFYTVLRTPRLSPDCSLYEMERIDTSLFLSYVESPSHVQEEIEFLKGELEQKGVVLIDYELFYQSDQTVMILDFNRCVLFSPES